MATSYGLHMSASSLRRLRIICNWQELPGLGVFHCLLSFYNYFFDVT